MGERGRRVGETRGEDKVCIKNPKKVFLECLYVPQKPTCTLSARTQRCRRVPLLPTADNDKEKGKKKKRKRNEGKKRKKKGGKAFK